MSYRITLSAQQARLIRSVNPYVWAYLDSCVMQQDITVPETGAVFLRNGYNIVLNENHRQSLIASFPAPPAGYDYQYDNTDEDEAFVLRQLLIELPQVEAECPGCDHGFAL